MADFQWIFVLLFILAHFLPTYPAPTEEPDYAEKPDLSKPPEHVQEPELSEGPNYVDVPEDGRSTIVSLSSEFMSCLLNKMFAVR